MQVIKILIINHLHVFETCIKKEFASAGNVHLCINSPVSLQLYSD